MIRDKSLLMIPGPTPVPPSVAAAQTAPMINHRGEAFNLLHAEVVERLQGVFRTQQTVYVFPSAGTGGFETALVNTLDHGARVLALPCGSFGDRFAKVAEGLGYQVDRVETEWGQAVDTAAVAERLRQDKEHAIKALLMTHNETSTGVTNDIKALAALAKAHGALSLVDSISGLAALPLEFDEWCIDVCFTGSQKALACPPGLLPIAFSLAGQARIKEAKSYRAYFDLRPYVKGWADHNLPYTPAVSLWYALREALRLLGEETLAGSWARHRLLGTMARAGVKAMGLKLLVADEAHASNSVTAVHTPAGLTPKELRATARKVFGVQLAGGQGKVENSVFRIGHLGHIMPYDVVSALVAAEQALAHHDYPVTFGAAAGAAQKVWLETVKR